MAEQLTAVVIEDEPRISDLVRMLLKKVGFHVEVAADGETGLALVRELKPDLLISDMLLPKLHGVDVCRAVRKDPDLAHVRIIAMTAIYKKMKFGMDINELKVDAFLEKPFDINELQHIVKNMFPGAKPQGAQPDQGSEESGNLPVADAVQRVASKWAQFTHSPMSGLVLEELQGAVLGLYALAVNDDDPELTHKSSELKRLVASIAAKGGALLQTTEAQVGAVLSDLKGLVGLDRQPAGAVEQVDRDAAGSVPGKQTVSGGENLPPIWMISPAPERLGRYAAQFGALGFRLHTADLDRGTPEVSGAVGAIVDFRTVRDLHAIPKQIGEWRFRLADTVPILALVPSEAGTPAGIMAMMGAGAAHVMLPPLDVWSVVRRLVESPPKAHRVQGRILVLDSTSHAAPARVIPASLGYTTRVATDPDELADLLVTVDPELVLVGEQFGQLRGGDLVRFIRRQVPGLDIVSVVHEPDAAPIGELIQAGAVGVIAPQMAAPLLAASLDAALQRSRARRATTGRFPDSGLMLRSAFLEHAASWLRGAGKSVSELAVCAIRLPGLSSLALEGGRAVVTHVYQCLDYMARMWDGQAFCGLLADGELVIGLPGFSEERAVAWTQSLAEGFSRLTFSIGRSERAVDLRWSVVSVRAADELPTALDAAMAKNRENSG